MTASVLSGCGVNVSNKHPTMSVNDCISLHNARTGSSLAPLSVEQVLAATLNKLEMYLGQYEAVEMAAMEQLYYKYWLHRSDEKDKIIVLYYKRSGRILVLLYLQS